MFVKAGDKFIQTDNITYFKRVPEKEAITIYFGESLAITLHKADADEFWDHFRSLDKSERVLFND